MKYNGLDQIGDALVSPSISSQGRVIIGSCDEIGGPYLQSVSSVLSDTITSSDKKSNINTTYGILNSISASTIIPRVLCQPAAIINGISTYCKDTYHNIIYKHICKVQLPHRVNTSFSYPILNSFRIFETRGNSITSYIKERLSIAHDYSTNIVKDIINKLLTIVITGDKHFKNLFEHISLPTPIISKVADITHVETANIGVSPLIRKISTYMEEAISTIHDRAIVLSKNIYDILSATSISISSPIHNFTASLKMADTLPSIVSPNLLEHLHVMEEKISSSIYSNLSERLHTAGKQITSTITSFKHSMNITGTIGRVHMINFEEIIHYVEKRSSSATIYISNLLSSIESHTSHVRKLFIEHSFASYIPDIVGVQKSIIHNIKMAETRTISAIFTIKESQIFLDVLNTPFGHYLIEGIKVSGKVSSDTLKYIKELCQLAGRNISSTLSSIIETISISYTHAPFTQVNIKETINTIYTYATSSSYTIKHLVTTSTTETANLLPSAYEYGIEFIDTAATSIYSYIINICKLSERETKTLYRTFIETIHHIETKTSSTLISFFSKLNFIPKDISNIYKSATSGIIFTESHKRSFISIHKEILSSSHIHVTTAIYKIKNYIKTTDIQFSSISSIFSHIIGITDTTKKSILSTFTESISHINYHITHISKSFRNKLSHGDTKLLTSTINIKHSISTSASHLLSHTHICHEVISAIQGYTNGIKISISKLLRESIISSITITVRSMIQLLEETLLHHIIHTHPLKRIVETISTGVVYTHYLLHVLSESTALLQYRQSRVTSLVVHRLGIVSGGVTNVAKAFIASITSSDSILRYPSKILAERATTGYIIFQSTVSLLTEEVRTVTTMVTSPLKYIKERISSAVNFKHRMAGLVTRPYVTAQRLSKPARARASKSFATLKSYLKNTEVTHQGDDK